MVGSFYTRKQFLE